MWNVDMAGHFRVVLLKVPTNPTIIVLMEGLTPSYLAARSSRVLLSSRSLRPEQSEQSAFEPLSL